MSFDLPDWTTVSTPEGLNLILDKLTQGAFTGRVATISNDNGVADGTDPPANVTAQTYWGKFFPRGCRGMLAALYIYCKRTATGTLTLSYAPQPGMGAVGSVTITPGAAWAWKTNTVRKAWNYDSLFIWISACSADVSYGYDTTAPLDQFISADSGVLWYLGANRIYIYAAIQGATVGDIPVCGTLNSIPIPATASQASSGVMPCPDGVVTTVISKEGAGYVEFIFIQIQAQTASHETVFEIQCDDVFAYGQAFSALKAWTFTASTPGVSLVAYAVDGACVVVITTRFEFRRKFAITIEPIGHSQVTWTVAVCNLIG